ncbi:MAG: hypothetical protein ACLFT0_20545, partial [Spirulinaceae cyanobacterium]
MSVTRCGDFLEHLEQTRSPRRNSIDWKQFAPMGRCGFSGLSSTRVKARQDKGLRGFGLATHPRTLYHQGFSDFGVAFSGSECYIKRCSAQLHLENYIS